MTFRSNLIAFRKLIFFRGNQSAGVNAVMCSVVEWLLQCQVVTFCKNLSLRLRSTGLMGLRHVTRFGKRKISLVKCTVYITWDLLFHSSGSRIRTCIPKVINTVSISGYASVLIWIHVLDVEYSTLLCEESHKGTGSWLGRWSFAAQPTRRIIS